MKKIVPTVFLLLLFGLANGFADELTREKVLSFDVRKVLGNLEESLSIHDEIDTLKESKWFGRDQEAARKDLDELLNKAIDLLDSPVISDLREQNQKIEQRLAEEEQKLVDYRSERVLAVREDRSLRTRLVPGKKLKSFVAVTKADYDMLIDSTEKNIEAYKEESALIMEKMSNALDAIGVDLNRDQLETLMSSVVGDDIVTMAVVFNAIRDMTLQLAELTQESGENLGHAKKYYGMVVILYQIIMTMQEKFINQVNEGYLPKLAVYRENARDYISESKSLMKNGVNIQTLQQNIQSNEFTIKVIDLYAELLKNQKDKVSRAYEATIREMKVANNTYNTVSLSSAVASMIREGTNTFDQLIGLQMPDIREFNNDEIRDEFRILTERMNQSQ